MVDMREGPDRRETRNGASRTGLELPDSKRFAPLLGIRSSSVVGLTYFHVAHFLEVVYVPLILLSHLCGACSPGELSFKDEKYPFTEHALKILPNLPSLNLTWFCAFSCQRPWRTKPYILVWASSAKP